MDYKSEKAQFYTTWKCFVLTSLLAKRKASTVSCAIKYLHNTRNPHTTKAQQTLSFRALKGTGFWVNNSYGYSVSKEPPQSLSSGLSYRLLKCQDFPQRIHLGTPTYIDTLVHEATYGSVLSIHT